MQSFLRAVTLAAVFLFLAGCVQEQKVKPAPKEVNVSIKFVDGAWKAVLTDTKITEVHVNSGDKVIFHAEGTDVYFQFGEEKLFGGHTKSLNDGQQLMLSVGQVARGVYTYAAFCEGPKVFARGDSPPKIIVD